MVHEMIDGTYRHTTPPFVIFVYTDNTKVVLTLNPNAFHHFGKAWVGVQVVEHRINS